MSKSVLIAEQSEIIRKGLGQVLSEFSNYNPIRDVSCQATMKESVEKHNPDLLLVNPALASGGLLNDLKQNSRSDMKVVAIVYSLFDDDYLSQFDEVIAVSDSRNKIRKKLDSLFEQEEVKTPSKPEEALSARELEVLKLLVKGLSNKEISDKLFISTHTVISHRKNITGKLNIKSVAGLTIYAIINEIITIDDVQ